MITYQDNTKKTYYDFTMLASILRVHPSNLKRAMKGYGFTDNDFIKYNNRHLYSENAVVEFIVYLVKGKLYAELRKTEQAAQKINRIHE